VAELDPNNGGVLIVQLNGGNTTHGDLELGADEITRDWTRKMMDAESCEQTWRT